MPQPFASFYCDDPRVIVIEGVNVLGIGRWSLVIHLVTIDVSLTSLRLVLPVVRKWLEKGGSVVALLKPQYEADPKDLRHGVVRSDATREKIVAEFRAWLGANGWVERGMVESSIRGSEGNVEYLFHLAVRHGN